MDWTNLWPPLSDYLLLDLKLDGEIKWFEAMDYYEDKPIEYWDGASDEPLNSTTTEGIFHGVARIEKIVKRNI